MYVTPQEKRDLSIEQSRNGRGIFSKKKYNTNSIIFEVTGNYITCNEDDSIDEEIRNNTYRYDRDLYISPAGRIGDMLNHSCNSNAKIVKEKQKLFVCAIKNITAGREIVIDYSTILARDDSWSMKCNCGSTKCRGKIGSFNRLSQGLKVMYKKHNIVPGYILEI